MMNQQQMIQSLRVEIAKLQRVIDLLVDQPSAAEEIRRPGRPKGSSAHAPSFNPEEFTPKKRTMSVEGKARIAAAQKKRWAAQKNVTTGSSPRNEAAPKKRTGKTTPSKSAGKVTAATAKKSSGAGKKTGSTKADSQSASAKKKTIVAKKTAGKKTATKVSSKQATKRQVKQAVTVTPEA